MMYMEEYWVKHKEKIIKSFKIALAAFIAIGIAGELSLKYSATAGIITILSIQNTKKETLVSARNRALAFLCALLISFLSFRFLGYTLLGFGVYLFLFALLCLYMGWGEAISMDSVLVTHFLLEESMAFFMIGNELGLFLIGTGIGILVNWHLRRKEKEYNRLAENVDRLIKGILFRMGEWLLKEDKSQYDSTCFQELKEGLEDAKLCAIKNYNNDVFGKNIEELEYIKMREQQSVILQEIYENIKGITYLPKQAKEVSNLLFQIEQEYHKENTVEGLLEELELLLEQMKEEELPSTREEFEARAILFYILKQLKKLLWIKRDYILS